jgi:tetratricopeptide (TPR) repeat protein
MAKNKAKDDNIINVDEVYTKTEQFVDKNRNQLTLILGGVAVIIIAFMGYRTLVQLPAELAAEEAIFQAEYYFSIDSLDLAQYGDGFAAGLEEVMADHPGTDAASRAAYQIGVTNRDAGLYAEAILAFDNVDFDDNVIGPMALAGMGDCYAELEDYTNAAVYFSKAADAADTGLAGKVLAPSYHYKQAITLIELGRIDEAKSVLTHIENDHPNSRMFSPAVALGASL